MTAKPDTVKIEVVPTIIAEAPTPPQDKLLDTGLNDLASTPIKSTQPVAAGGITNSPTTDAAIKAIAAAPDNKTAGNNPSAAPATSTLDQVVAALVPPIKPADKGSAAEAIQKAEPQANAFADTAGTKTGETINAGIKLAGEGVDAAKKTIHDITSPAADGTAAATQNPLQGAADAASETAKKAGNWFSGLKFNAGSIIAGILGGGAAVLAGGLFGNGPLKMIFTFMLAPALALLSAGKFGDGINNWLSGFGGKHTGANAQGDTPGQSQQYGQGYGQQRGYGSEFVDNHAYERYVEQSYHDRPSGDRYAYGDVPAGYAPSPYYDEGRHSQVAAVSWHVNANIRYDSNQRDHDDYRDHRMPTGKPGYIGRP